MKTIGERIHSGESAGDIGLRDDDYARRVILLQRYLEEHDNTFSPDTYTDWYYDQPENKQTEGTCCTHGLEEGKIYFESEDGMVVIEDMTYAAVKTTSGGRIEATPLQMAGSALSTIGSFIGSGFKTVDAEEEARRWGICESCEYLTEAKENKNRRCTKCGCYMWLKVKIEHVHCNLNKW